MKQLIAGLVIASGAMLLYAPTAEAHHKHYDKHYDKRYGQHQIYYDRGYMPRWLRKHRPFRHWYRHTPLKHNYRLDWHELYDIYRWETRYSRARYHRYQHHHQRDYRYYRDYWKHDRHGERKRKKKHRRYDD